MMAGRVDLKVVMLGQTACGKTSIVERFIYDRFNTNYQATIGAAFGARRVDVAGRVVCVGLWDTAGSERYQAMSRIYYRDAAAAVICYDITDKDSFERAKFWVGEVRAHEDQCRLYLCGTKKDLVLANPHLRQVDYHDVVEFADQVDAKVFETSSKSGEQVDELFRTVVEDFAQHNAAVMATLDKSTIVLTDAQPRKKCCS